MNENFDQDFELDDYEMRRRERRKKRKRKVAIQKAVFIIVFLAIIGLGVFAGMKFFLKDGFSTANQNTLTQNTQGNTQTEKLQQTQTVETESETAAEENLPDETEPSTASSASSGEVSSILEEAKLLAMGYDYDGAIQLLKTVPSYEANADVTSAIEEYEATKASCVAVDVTTVPHIFYHSLVNDPDRAFSASVMGQSQADGMNAWMTTVEEFDKITQAMYDNGYVFVRLRDLVVESTDENGNVTFTPNNNLLLPPGKKAVVLSVDDLSYYHSYEAAGYPDKLIIDENGKVKCHYVSSDGTEQVVDFDVVPRLNTFLEEHPDGAYKGARGLIALTGYNGVFGYRTDEDYEKRENLMEDQSKWLSEHPDYNRQSEIDEATKVANAIKESGWEFASHTWGHLSVTNKTVDDLKRDNTKWVNNVQNIVGPVDTIIFAHGNDIGDWQDYSSDNEKFQYFKSAGYNFYCNVDGSVPYWVQIRSNYVRQGRINLDGYMLYQSSIGATTVLDNMFKASAVFDSRRPTPVVANGEA